MYIMPIGEVLTEAGPNICVAVPAASPELPPVPVPTTVVTTRVGEILRTRCPAYSATKIASVRGSKLGRDGWLNFAAAPVPSAYPAAPLPATVLTLQ